jgi:hypothetical protein
MLFTVRFRAVHGAVQMQEQQLGTRGLHAARRTYPDAAVEDVYGVVAQLVVNPEILVPFEEAVQLAAFEEQHAITVNVPSGALNAYVDLKWYRTRHHDAEMVTPLWVINTDFVLTDWIAVGAPLDWVPGPAPETQPAAGGAQ